MGLLGADSVDAPYLAQWFVLYTRTRQEKALAQDLAARGIQHFLPLVRQSKYHGQRKVTVELPLFPGYLFLRGATEDAYLADRTGRVARILPVSNQRQIDWELSNVALALDRGAMLDAYPYLKKGVKVEVRSGPFRGLQGIVEERLNPGRLLLQVQMLGRAVSLEIEASLLDSIQ
jgi:transcription antitermination factor NusG